MEQNNFLKLKNIKIKLLSNRIKNAKIQEQLNKKKEFIKQQIIEKRNKAFTIAFTTKNKDIIKKTENEIHNILLQNNLQETDLKDNEIEEEYLKNEEYKIIGNSNNIDKKYYDKILQQWEQQKIRKKIEQKQVLKSRIVRIRNKKIYYYGKLKRQRNENKKYMVIFSDMRISKNQIISNNHR